MSVNYTPDMNNYADLGAFRFWCQKVLPLVYDDSLSYYELLCKVVNFLNETIKNVGLMGEDIEKLYTAYTQLEQYVNSYFDNLDVQDEINNKLNNMAKDGSLSALIQPLFDEYKAEITGDINSLTRKINQNETSISVLQSRVDNFTNLPNGSTTGDAELADARVAFNGANHTNAGDAIRYGDTRNHEHIVGSAVAIADNEYMYKTYKSVLLDIGWERGGFLSSDTGLVTDNSNYADCVTTGFVKLTDYPVLYITGGYAYLAAIVALYDSDKNYLGSVWGGVKQGEVGYDVYHTWDTKKFTITDALAIDMRAVYARFGCYNNANYNHLFNVEIIDKENSLTVEQYNKLRDKLNTNSINTKISKFTSILDKVNTITGAYLDGGKGILVEGWDTAITTDFIKLSEYPELFVTGFYRAGTAIFALYDKDMNFLYGEWSRKQNTDPEYQTINKWEHKRFTIFDAHNINPRAVYVRFSSWRSNTLPMYLDVAVAERISSFADAGANSGNVLWGKKYIACGDSWTHGAWNNWVDENGLSKEESPVIYDKELDMYKTYPWWIAKRNNMVVTNEAISGSIMALDKEYVADKDNVSINLRFPFSYNRYMAIPEDADYVTILFGINDASHTNLGTINDTTNETFYGAYNMVMEWLLTNRPYTKIGLIVTHFSTPEYRQAVREIGRRWGVLVLDLMGDDTPAMFGRESGLCEQAQTLRRNAYRISEDDFHPNLEGHKHMSTFIEAFLRRL